MNQQVKIYNLNSDLTRGSSNFLGIMLALLIIIPYSISMIWLIGGIPTYIGLALSALIMLSLIRYKLRVPTEVIMYLVWLVWATITYITTDTANFYYNEYWAGIKTCFQIWILLFIVCMTTYIRGKVEINFLAILITSLIFILYALSIGNFSFMLTGYERVHNVNEFGYQVAICIACVMYFFYEKSFKQRMIVITIILILFSFLIIAASRKNFLGALTFMALFALLYFIRKFKINIFTATGMILIYIILYFIYQYIYETTFLGARLSTVAELGLAKAEHSRIEMYIMGWDLFLKFPIFGAGLNQNQPITGWYSHSDYIEVLSTTGIVGFLLYFSFHLILLIRLLRIGRNTSNPKILFTIDLFKSIVIMTMLIALGRPNESAKVHWILMGSISGYAYYIEQKIIFPAKMYCRKKQLSTP